MILLGGMPRLNNPMFAWDLFQRGASRGFFLSWRPDRKFTTASVTELLHDLGASDITAIHQEAFDHRGDKDHHGTLLSFSFCFVTLLVVSHGRAARLLLSAA